MHVEWILMPLYDLSFHLLLLQATKKVSIVNSEGPMKAIADIRLRIEHGASVNEVISAYEAHEFQTLKKLNHRWQ